MQIVSVADEPRIRPNADDDEGVPAVGAAEPGVPLSADSNLLAVVNPPRHVDLQLLRRDETPVAAAIAAGVFEDRAHALALRACPLLHELPEDVLRDAFARPPPRRTSDTFARTFRAPRRSPRSARTAARPAREPRPRSR